MKEFEDARNLQNTEIIKTLKEENNFVTNDVVIKEQEQNKAEGQPKKDPIKKPDSSRNNTKTPK